MKNGLLYVLFSFLCMVLFFLSNTPIQTTQSKSLAADEITPSYFYIAPCPSCTDVTPSVGAPVSVVVPPASPAISHQPTTIPCQPATTASTKDTSIQSHTVRKRDRGDISRLFEFLLELLKRLIEIFFNGGNTQPAPNPSPAPDNNGDQPNQQPAPSSGSPVEPTLMPCPTSVQAEPTGEIPNEPTIGPTQAPEMTQVPQVTQPAQPPAEGGNINLSNWKLQLPTGQQGKVDEVKQPQLAYYTNSPWYVPSGGSITFRAPVSGVTTSGSKYPRSELREMTNNGATQAAWDPKTGTHTMTIDEAITAVPTTKKHVVAGQIHDGSDDIIVVRLELPKLIIKIGDTTGPVLDANYTLGKRFTVKFEAKDGVTSIYYNGSTTPIYTMTQSYTTAYFKAGAYTQSNCTTETSAPCDESNYGEVVIYNLSVSHQ